MTAGPALLAACGKRTRGDDSPRVPLPLEMAVQAPSARFCGSPMRSRPVKNDPSALPRLLMVLLGPFAARRTTFARFGGRLREGRCA